ncbi:MAG TPA: tyrosine-type recombinase/integrase [Phenylobacterium sp.]|nr:tyrosine-type recombinase/integrase [Phenylobacterium sp.]HVI33185.1 tyrosine-type recombinase/integrase [Phenylobacterium sp.]
MARVAKELGPLAVSRLTTPGLHAVGGVSGLYLQVLPPRPDPEDPTKIVPGGRSWVLRAMVGGKRRDMGLGGFPSVTLAGARERARDARDKIDKGFDPIEVRRAAKAALRADDAKLVTFEDAAKAYMAAHESSWRNAKHREQWRNTLTGLAYPHLGKLAVRDIEVAHVLAVLEPIWRVRTETANRLRGRMELVLDWATARGYREGLNPARWKGHLDKMLPNPTKLKPKGHMAAMAIGDVPAFMVRLRAAGGTGARALEFVVLTAARSGEVRGATWSEIDLRDKVWTIPASRMKMGKEHRVPLSAQAMALLEALPRFADTDLVFPSASGTPLSDRTLLAVLRRMDVDVTAHGFRSTFRDWCGEFTNFPREVAEAALAHTTGSSVEQAYRRGDALEKRRKLMEAWAAFLSRPVAAKRGNVKPLQGAAA